MRLPRKSARSSPPKSGDGAAQGGRTAAASWPHPEIHVEEKPQEIGKNRAESLRIRRGEVRRTGKNR